MPFQAARAASRALSITDGTPPRHTFQAARNQSGSLKNGCTVNLSYIKAKRVI